MVAALPFRTIVQTSFSAGVPVSVTAAEIGSIVRALIGVTSMVGAKATGGVPMFTISTVAPAETATKSANELIVIAIAPAFVAGVAGEAVTLWVVVKESATALTIASLAMVTRSSTTRICSTLTLATR